MAAKLPLTTLDLHNLAVMPGGPTGDYRTASACRADHDGDCFWEHCPQIRDNEPNASGRHCPLDCPPFRADEED